MPPVKNVTDQFELVPTSKFPHAKFSFEKFNPVQSRVFEFFDKDNNFVIASSTSSGKAQPIDSLVITPTGYKKIGNLKVGDCVIGSEGKAVKITGVYPQGIKKIYEVFFQDGVSTKCCGEHLWNVKSHDSDFKTVTLMSGWFEPKKYHIPYINKPIEFHSDDNFYIHPYILGLIIGDDIIKYDGKISISNPRILNKFSEFLPNDIKLVKETNYENNYMISSLTSYNSIVTALMEMGLFGKSAKNKFIPNVYKFSSIKSRIYLLRGLMDSSRGITNQSQSPNFEAISKELAFDVAFLVRSLGGYTSFYREEDVYKSTVSFKNLNPFGFSSKKDKWCPEVLERLRLITDIQECSDSECVCISVDADDGLYCTNDFILTHNTAISEMILSHEIRVKGNKGIYLVPMRALAQEKYDDWTDSNHHFSDLNISICTGDYRLTTARKKELDNANLIVMSSEILNSRCRNRSSEKTSFLNKVKALVVDESHLLTVPGRGDHLESGLMKFTEMNPDARIVLLSATMPNVAEIADWVSYVLTGKDTVLLKSNYRPCPLYLHFEEYWDGERNYDDNERQKVNTALEIVDYYPEDKFLIFAHTKRTGAFMKKALDDCGITCEYHNADIKKDKRIKLEKDFKNKNDPRVLVATSTLAWGCYKVGSPIQMADGSIKDVEQLLVGDRLMSFDDKSFVGANVVKIEKRKKKKSLKFTLDSGEVCEVTLDHFFYGTTDRNSPDWVRADVLKPGDFLAVPNKYHLPYVQSSDLGYVIGYALGDGCLVDCGFHANGSRKLMLDITGDTEDLDHLNYCKNLISKFANYDIFDVRQSEDGVSHIQCKAKSVTDIFEQHLTIGRKGDSLRISNSLTEDRSVIKGVLQGLMDADGGVVDHGNGNFSIEFSTISHTLALQVQQLLKPFGVFSCVGKKRMKDRVINGRHQKAVREWCWRVRIYNEEAICFRDNVGFRMNRKVLSLASKVLKTHSANNTKCLLPVRDLIKNHALANEVSANSMCKSLGLDLWSILNKKELTKATVRKIAEKYPEHSKLIEALDCDLIWRKIKKVELLKGGEFVELEVSDTHNYVGCGIVSHNCNLPARRVIILGVHRGIDEVATYDLQQMQGRAGRPAFDPVGDAYILLPQKQFDYHKNRLKKQQPITSQMLEDFGGNHKILAFHLVSEIHNENIKCKRDVHHWYKRSLASFQSHDFDDEVVEGVLNLLKKCGAVWEDEDGKLTVMAIGKIASMFYYSPFDVSDLKRNFRFLINGNNYKDDFMLSIALGNIDSHKFGIVSKSEREAISKFDKKVTTIFGKGKILEPAIKASCAYYNLLTGVNNDSINSTMNQLRFDYPRTNQVLQAIDGFTGRWNMKDWFNKIQMRISYGVKEELVYLCQLPDVGKVRAERLYKAGIKHPKDILGNETKAQRLLGFKKDKFNIVLDKIKDIS